MFFVSHHLYFLLLFLILIFLVFSLKSYNEMEKWLAAFAARRIKSWKNKGRIFLLAWLLLLVVFFLAGVGVEYETVKTQREGIHIIIGLDVSRSMLAEDTVIPDQQIFLNKEYPSRLNRAKFEALNFIDLLDGEKLGMFFFAFTDSTIAPLTKDYQFCKYTLLNTDNLNIAFTGSDFSNALLSAKKLFTDNSLHKVVVIFSDGELENDSEMEDVRTQAKMLKDENILVYSVAIGGDKPAFIPLRDSPSSQNYFTDLNDELITTKVNRTVLKELSSITGGEFFFAGNFGVSQMLFDSILQGAEYSEKVNVPVKKKVDLSSLFLVILLVSWLVWEIVVYIF